MLFVWVIVFCVLAPLVQGMESGRSDNTFVQGQVAPPHRGRKSSVPVIRSMGRLTEGLPAQLGTNRSSAGSDVWPSAPGAGAYDGSSVPSARSSAEDEMVNLSARRRTSFLQHMQQHYVRACLPCLLCAHVECDCCVLCWRHTAEVRHARRCGRQSPVSSARHAAELDAVSVGVCSAAGRPGSVCFAGIGFARQLQA